MPPVDGIIDAWDLAWIGIHFGLNYHFSPFVTGWAPSPVVKVVASVRLVEVGEYFAVDIAIENVEGLNTYEFTLSWDPQVIALIPPVKGGGFISSPEYGIPSIIGAGYVYVGDGLSPTWPYPTQSGSGILAKMTFKCLGEGETTLDLSSRLFPLPTFVSMPHEDQDGACVCVSSLTEQDRTQRLIETLETWNLPTGTESSLTSKLKDVLRLLEKGNENGAVRKLTDFISQAEAMRDNKLTNEQADYLIAEAQKTIDLIQG